MEAGFGLLAGASGRAEVEQLLPAPELVNGGKVQVDPAVVLELSAVPGAAAYKVQLSPDAGFLDIAAEQISPRPAVSFSAVPNGAWFARSTALAPSGLEGLPSVAVFRRVLTGLTASADGDASLMRFRWDSSGEGRRIYRFQLRKGSKEALSQVDEVGLEEPELSLRNLAPGRYYWRVAVRQFSSEGVTENWLPFNALSVPEPER